MSKNTIALLISLLVAFLIGILSIQIFGEYGWTVFCMVPLIIGFLPAFIIGKGKTITKKDAFKISFLVFLCVIVLLLAMALEGLIFIIMALPFAIPLVFLGSYLGYISTQSDKINNSNVLLVFLIASIGSMSFDIINEPKELIPVTTTIIVNAPIDSVWNNVVTFDKIGEPTDWLFSTGIAYPTEATIKGKGVGAIRYCNFTTGSFVEPITIWNEPTLLKFDVIDQPAPMSEFNPFWDIHPKHLDGYFMSQRGEFKLRKIDKYKTELKGTTWYKVDITPEWYWAKWSDFIIHRIHLRVLNHIKTESEK